MDADRQAVTAADRLGLTLFLAAAIHGLIILGVGFAPLGPPPPASQALDVVLLQQHTDQAPENADYLANANAAGGGNQPDKARPRAPVSSPERVRNPGMAPAPLEAGAPQSSPTKTKPVLTRRQSEQKTNTAKEQPEPSQPEKPKTAEEVEYEARIAQLAAEVDDALSRYAQRPRKKFVTASARQSPAARYMHDWVEQVERIGNLNYPDAARNRGLSGALVLVVAIEPDGSLHEVRVRASSGHSVLDQAAKRIVRMAAPVKPFSDELRQKTDILYITRTWQFDAGEVTTRAADQGT
jgi:protein TonB